MLIISLALFNERGLVLFIKRSHYMERKFQKLQTTQNKALQYTGQITGYSSKHIHEQADKVLKSIKYFFLNKF